MAPKTDKRFTRDLMFEAVPYSSANILLTRLTCKENKKNSWSLNSHEIDAVDVNLKQISSFFVIYITSFLIYKLLELVISSLDG